MVKAVINTSLKHIPIEFNDIITVDFYGNDIRYMIIEDKNPRSELSVVLLNMENMTIYDRYRNLEELHKINIKTIMRSYGVTFSNE